MIAGRGAGDRFKATPGGVVRLLKGFEGAALILIVPHGEYSARINGEQEICDVALMRHLVVVPEPPL